VSESRREKRAKFVGVIAIALGALGGGALAIAFVGGLLDSELQSASSPPLRQPSAVPSSAAEPVDAAGPRATPAEAQPPQKGKRSTRPETPRSLDFAQTVYPQLTSIYDWPREPDAPTAPLDEKRFTEALVLLCGPHADREVRAWYAVFLLQGAREFGADPFLLGALMFRMSGCVQRAARPRAGLSGIAASLYRELIRRGVFRYRVFDEGTWRERSLSLKRFPFETAFIDSPESNLYFAAAFLRAWDEQARGSRAAFAQRSEYRHYVSHYVWGDSVQSHREEDWILVERRRLLEYYGAIKPRPPVRWHGFQLGCPLDGCPRVVTSTLGDARAGGTRLHAGNDFESTQGEPVRAIADGSVVFAGVDLPGRGAASRIPIWAQRNVDPAAMGAGGLYVCIDHGQSHSGESLVSCYMHLETASVVLGRSVARGDQVGIVGTSGIKESRPHLHFELHSSAGVHKATDVLSGLALGNPVPHPAEAGAPLSGQDPK
jgi:murein DD-endopeptidase MepM/ murein hydrolase activator NlpD